MRTHADEGRSVPFASIHARLIGVALEEVQTDPEVVGVLLQGSVARGDAYPDSDLDLFVLLRDGCHRSFRSVEREGILVEWHFYDQERATAKLRANPMLVYGFLDGKILRDDTGALEALRGVAHDICASYRTPLGERDGILYWLQSARIKIRAALNGGDLLKASFVATTTSWKVLEGVWAINDLPMPPSGAVITHKGDLMRVPEDWDRLFDQLFISDTAKRVEAVLTVIDWLMTSS